MPSKTRIITCTNCHRTLHLGGYGWCYACYYRWRRAGRPDTGPPPALDPQTVHLLAEEGRRAARRARIEDYLFILDTCPGISVTAAAERMGVTTRTIYRWNAALRAEQNQAAA
ncbi:hypothetical protein ACFWYW_47090 [Nonomuraea sp. NPDC059023]|uniref:hypothetical protein n=1 Tax=unclassified Nonomuraea TaxID=2593643 RepID=UPI0036C347FC